MTIHMKCQILFSGKNYDDKKSMINLSSAEFDHRSVQLNWLGKVINPSPAEPGYVLTLQTG